MTLLSHQLCLCLYRLQELEEQYRKEREETNNLLEQQRLVSDVNNIKSLKIKVYFPYS